MTKPHDRNASRAYCCQQFGAHDVRRARAELSHDAACDWLDENPIPCGADRDGVRAHLERCRDAVATRYGFFDPGSIMLIWNVISLLWTFLEWWWGQTSLA